MPLKSGWAELGVRVVPPATVRQGAYVRPGRVLMPSYVNVGRWVGSGTMVDTWATVGSCAQIGTDVHLSGGRRHRRRPRAAAGQPGDRRGRRLRRLALRSSSRGVRGRPGKRCWCQHRVALGSTPIIDVRGKKPVEICAARCPRAIVHPRLRGKKKFPAVQLPHPVRVSSSASAAASTDR
jgi:2,3,4,5-tetrahydropyridine-2-carboxylate N-succinyltransferase